MKAAVIAAALALGAAQLPAFPTTYYDASGGDLKASFRNSRCYRITWKDGARRKSGWLTGQGLRPGAYTVKPDDFNGRIQVEKWLVVSIEQVVGSGCIR